MHRCAPLCTVGARSLLNPLFYYGKNQSVHRQFTNLLAFPCLIPYFTMGKWTGLRPAAGRPKVGWHDRPQAGLRPACEKQICRNSILKTSFLTKIIILKIMLFSCGWTFPEEISGIFILLRYVIFMKKHDTNHFCVIFCENLYF